jgi:Ca-activated chloride channel homolog
MRTRIAVMVLAVAVVAIAFAASPDGERERGAMAPKVVAAVDAVPVPFVYSPENEPLLKPLVERFNAEHRAIVVKPEVVASGDAESRIARGTLKPVAWSPASSLWGRLLNYEADRELTPRRSPSIVRTPLVIAMWEPMARALGWPDRPIGFADLVRLSRSGAGWGDFGHPEWGPFKLVHTNPDFSTSGLSAVVAEYYAATGKKEGLTERDVTSSSARQIVRDLERSIVHYGDTTLFIADQLREHGPGYASAVAMEEVTLLEFNRDRGSRPKLVAVYPEEGTFHSDNPFIVLDADWVDARQRRAAETFQRFLAERITPAVAARAGFRPADLDAKPVAPVSAANGVDPAQPKRVLGLPDPRVLARLKQTWRVDRKPANVLLVLDSSGSMQDSDRLERAKDGIRVFLDQAAPQDRIGLTAFSDAVVPLVPVGGERERLTAAVDGLIAEGGTALYDAASSAFTAVRALATDDSRINAVVLLSDGEDTDSAKQLENVLAELDQGDSEQRVRVFTIAYSAQADGAAEALKRISAASGGKAYGGDTDDIESVYRSISSFF